MIRIGAAIGWGLMLFGCAAPRHQLIPAEEVFPPEVPADPGAATVHLPSPEGMFLPLPDVEPDPLGTGDSPAPEEDSSWVLPDWTPVESPLLGPTLSPEEAHAALNQIANSFRRGAYGGELLPQLEQVAQLSQDDSVSARIAWVRERIEVRDNTFLAEQMGQIDEALRLGKLDAALRIDTVLSRAVPHLRSDPAWTARRSSLASLSEEDSQQCSGVECDRLYDRGEAAFRNKHYSEAVTLARKAAMGDDDRRRQRGWALLRRTGEALCTENRQRALDAVRLFQKGKQRDHLTTARSRLEECLSLYPEYEHRPKVERDLQTMIQWEK